MRDLLAKIQRLNEQSGGELNELELIANKYPDGSPRQFIAVSMRLLTPIDGDRDIWHMFQAADKIDPTVTRGPNALATSEGGYQTMNGPYGPMGATARIVMGKYVLYAGAIASLYALAEKLSH